MDIDNLAQSKIDDYISSEMIDRMIFDIKTQTNPLIGLKLSVISFFRSNKPIVSSLETSIAIRD